MQEYVLGPGMGQLGWRDGGLSPATVLCQVVFVQQVLEGVLFFFSLPLSFFPFFTSLPKYSASQLRWGAGSAAWRTWGPSLHPRGAAQRGWAGERGC